MRIAHTNLNLQRIVTAIAVVLFIIKIIAWYVTRSIAVMTDALESVVNVIAGLVSLWALYIAAQPRDANHPYGHGKAEFLSAAVEGSLITVAGLVIIYEAIRHLIRPEPLKQLDIGIVLIAVTAIINYVTGYYCLRTGKKNNSLALIAGGKHLQTDTWSTIGIIGGLLLIRITGLHWIDSVTAIGLSLFILYTGYKIVRSSVAGIMDEADRALLQRMVEVLNANRRVNWIDLHNLRIIKYGHVLHIDCHLTVPWYLNVKEAHEEMELLSELIKKEFGESVELFVHADACVESSCSICIKMDCKVRLHPFEKRLEWTIGNISRNTRHTNEY
ncbi:MAG: cation diffusion facilitator family transporter [Chitinophagaceae bacterium]|nr:cation diffusion facilitator family transporter [Chitinophagaceae bacterium]